MTLLFIYRINQAEDLGFTAYDLDHKILLALDFFFTTDARQPLLFSG